MDWTFKHYFSISMALNSCNKIVIVWVSECKWALGVLGFYLRPLILVSLYYHIFFATITHLQNHWVMIPWFYNGGGTADFMKMKSLHTETFIKKGIIIMTDTWDHSIQPEIPNSAYQARNGGPAVGNLCDGPKYESILNCWKSDRVPTFNSRSIQGD